MSQKIGSVPQNKKQLPRYKNPLESLKDLGSHAAKSVSSDFGKLGGGLIDQFFGPYEDEEMMEEDPLRREQKQEQKPQRRKETIFNFREHYEKETIQRQIQELLGQIKSMTKAAEKEGSELMQEVREAEKMTIESLPPTPGIYHVRFLEQILSLLQVVRSKIGESRTWLEAMISKKKKRGSAFMSLSKKKGTQYSLSQELQSARSVQ